MKVARATETDGLEVDRLGNLQRPALVLTDEERRVLEVVARSRMVSAAKQERARMLLAYADGMPIAEIARSLHTYYYKVKRCLDRVPDAKQVTYAGSQHVSRSFQKLGCSPVFDQFHGVVDDPRHAHHADAIGRSVELALEPRELSSG